MNHHRTTTAQLHAASAFLQADEEDPVCQLPQIKEACKTSACASTLSHYTVRDRDRDLRMPASSMRVPDTTAGAMEAHQRASHRPYPLPLPLHCCTGHHSLSHLPNPVGVRRAHQRQGRR